MILMRKMKGSVLIQVLMTAVIVSVIAAAMMNLILLRAAAIKRGQDSAAGTALANSGMDTILASWNANNTSCYNAVPGFAGGSSASPPGNCGCSYTGTINGNNVTFCAGTGCSPAVATNPCTLAIVGTPPP